MKQQQQGDVLIEVSEIPAGAKPVNAINGKFVLALGEATGHAHTITSDDVELFDSGGILYFRTSSPVEVDHQEHHTQIIQPGTYRVGIVREHDYFADMVRSVAD